MSQTSLGMGSGLDDDSKSGIQVDRLVPEGITSGADLFYDYVAYVIFCEKHQKVALTQATLGKDVRAIWMPFVALPHNHKWKTSITEGLELILNQNKTESLLGHHKGRAANVAKLPVKSGRLLNLHRVAVPGSHKFMTRSIYLVKLESNLDFKCCETSKKLTWFPVKDIVEYKVAKLWGPEVVGAVKFCNVKKLKQRLLSEYTLKSAYQHVATKSKSPESKLIQTTNINARNVDIIYSDFLEFCFPSFFMNQHIFREFFNKYNYKMDSKRMAWLFNAFDHKRNTYINFNEFLLGLASWDPDSANEEFRVRFVFRYYDSDSDGVLNEPEFARLVKDIAPKESDEQIQQRVKNSLKDMGVTDNKVSLNTFVSTVSQLKFRKTSHLCRCPDRVVNKMLESMNSRSQMRLSLTKDTHLKAKRKKKCVCKQSKAKNYDWNSFGVILNSNGRCSSPSERFEYFCRDNANRIYSFEITFNPRSRANVLKDLIREFNPAKEKGFLCDERESLSDHLQSFVKELSLVFESEQRSIRINSPAYVFGDILGGLDDLMAIESVLCNTFPVVSANFVFLGNYVESGKWGVESIIYLLTLKMIAPNKVFLLRGRNEIRDSQRTFKKECIDKYGERYGEKIWQIINSVFDRMPIALTIDENIVCINSGINDTKAKVKDYNKFASVIKDPVKESEDVLQLLFNEPTDKMPKEAKLKYGFAKNTNLDKGLLFDESALKAFLKRNGLTHMIASNKPTTNGYKLWFGSKLINIFSNSKFKDFNNKCAALLVFQQTIRLIQIESHNRPVATKAAEDDTKTVLIKNTNA